MAFGERDYALLAARPGRLYLPESLPGGLVVGVVSKVSELPLLHFEHPTRRQAGKARTPGLGTECSFTDFTDPTDLHDWIIRRQPAALRRRIDPAGIIQPWRR